MSTQRLSERMVSVRVTGDDLSGYAAAAPTAHLKVFFPGPDGTLALPTPGPDGPVWPSDGPRPIMRTYTPRRYDANTKTLEMLFVLHGTGPAATWAAAAAPGDRLAVAGPGGRFALDPAIPQWLILGDESAIPAIGTLLDSVPTSAAVEVHVEVEGTPDRTLLDPSANVTVNWHTRADRPGDTLVTVAERAALPRDTHVWVGCEAQAVRTIRRHLLDAGHPPAAMTTRGYWRSGTADHPDHDYGEE